MDELRSSFERQYNDELEKAREEWKEEEVSKIKDEFMKEKEQLLKVGFTFCYSVLSAFNAFISVSVRVKIEVKFQSFCQQALLHFAWERNELQENAQTRVKASLLRATRFRDTPKCRAKLKNKLHHVKSLQRGFWFPLSVFNLKNIDR